MIVEQVQKITTFYEAKPNTWPEGVVVVVVDHGEQVGEEAAEHTGHSHLEVSHFGD